MPRTLPTLLIAGALAITATACGTDENEPQPPSPAGTPTAEATPDPDKRAARQLRAYLHESFGGKYSADAKTYWYDSAQFRWRAERHLATKKPRISRAL
jgi:hypothetical protein